MSDEKLPFSREQAGLILDPANAPHGFNDVDVSVTMTAAEWGIITSVLMVMGRMMRLPSHTEMAEKLHPQVVEYLNSLGRTDDDS